MIGQCDCQEREEWMGGPGLRKCRCAWKLGKMKIRGYRIELGWNECVSVPCFVISLCILVLSVFLLYLEFTHTPLQYNVIDGFHRGNAAEEYESRNTHHVPMIYTTNKYVRSTIDMLMTGSKESTLFEKIIHEASEKLWQSEGHITNQEECSHSTNELICEILFDGVYLPPIKRNNLGNVTIYPLCADKTDTYIPPVLSQDPFCHTDTVRAPCRMWTSSFLCSKFLTALKWIFMLEKTASKHLEREESRLGHILSLFQNHVHLQQFLEQRNNESPYLLSLISQRILTYQKTFFLTRPAALLAPSLLPSPTGKTSPHGKKISSVTSEKKFQIKEMVGCVNQQRRITCEKYLQGSLAPDGVTCCHSVMASQLMEEEREYLQAGHMMKSILQVPSSIFKDPSFFQVVKMAYNSDLHHMEEVKNHISLGKFKKFFQKLIRERDKVMLKEAPLECPISRLRVVKSQKRRKRIPKCVLETFSLPCRVPDLFDQWFFCSPRLLEDDASLSVPLLPSSSHLALPSAVTDYIHSQELDITKLPPYTSLAHSSRRDQGERWEAQVEYAAPCSRDSLLKICHMWIDGVVDTTHSYCCAKRCGETCSRDSEACLAALSSRNGEAISACCPNNDGKMCVLETLEGGCSLSHILSSSLLCRTSEKSTGGRPLERRDTTLMGVVSLTGSTPESSRVGKDRQERHPQEIPGSYSYSHAQKICKEREMRLCTLDEISATETNPLLEWKERSLSPLPNRSYWTSSTCLVGNIVAFPRESSRCVSPRRTTLLTLEKHNVMCCLEIDS